jgi:hypothetical protein
MDSEHNLHWELKIILRRGNLKLFIIENMNTEMKRNVFNEPGRYKKC